MIGPSLLLIGHAASGLAVFAAGWRRGRPGPAALPALFGVAAGPVGIVVALAVQRLLRGLAPDATGADWAAELGGRGMVTDRRLVDRVCDDRVRQPSPGELASLYDLQRFAGVPVRQRVIATAIRSFEPRLAPIVARALIDPDQSIRAQAAAAATDYQNNFGARRRMLEAAAAEPGAAHARRDLAMLLADNSAVTIFSDKVRATLRDDAVRALQALRDGGEGTPRVDVTLARLLTARGEPDAALALLDGHGDAPAGDDATLICRLDALFHAGRFDALRSACADLRATSRGVGPKLGSMIDFWAVAPTS